MKKQTAKKRTLIIKVYSITMKRRYFFARISVLPSFLVLLFGVGAGHALITASAMSVDKQNPCQPSCLAQSTITAPDQTKEVDNEDTQPRPAEAYYLFFTGFGWSLILLFGTLLLRHLCWRPPDIYALNAVYRI